MISVVYRVVCHLPIARVWWLLLFLFPTALSSFSLDLSWVSPYHSHSISRVSPPHSHSVSLDFALISLDPIESLISLLLSLSISLDPMQECLWSLSIQCRSTITMRDVEQGTLNQDLLGFDVMFEQVIYLCLWFFDLVSFVSCNSSDLYFSFVVSFDTRTRTCCFVWINQLSNCCAQISHWMLVFLPSSPLLV